MAVRIINADVFDGLAQLADESVHCVVTSPPYWGLRDYGTGKWEGGDPNCDHRSPTMREGRNEDRPKLAGSVATNSYQLRLAHHAPCGKCGAVKADRQIGQEPTLAEHIEVLVEVFREVRRVLRSDGVLWLNYGDAYDAGARATRDYSKTTKHGYWNISNRVSGGFKPKDLMLMASRLAIALQDDGWWVRSDVIWHKLNPMPESVTDRPTSAHEHIFQLTKSGRYFYDTEAVRETDCGRPSGNGLVRPERLSYAGRGNPDQWNPGGGRNLRNVWTIATSPFSEAHFATFPPDLAETCIKAGSSEHGCCSKCGAPWVRNIVRSEETDESYKGSRFDKGKTGQRDGGERTQNGERFKKVASGWSAGCDCGADVAPCVVLDPFGGAGTTALVADRLGRDAVLIELNPEYAAMAENRIVRDSPLFADVALG